MRTLPVIAATLTLVILAAPARADGTPPAFHTIAVADPDDDYDEAKQELQLELGESLAAVAKFCDKKKWLMERDRIYEVVIVLDPSHSKARRTLKYKKTRKGEWEQDDEYRPPRNKGRVDLDAVEAKEQECHQEHHDAQLKLLDKFEESLGEERVQAELREMLASSPGSDALYERLGYVEGWKGKPWVLPETKRSRERRKNLKAQATRLREEAPEATTTPYLDWEGDLGVDWAASLHNDRVRVVSANSEKEAARAAEVVWAAQDFVQDVLGIETVVPEGLTIYVMESEEDIKAFSAAYPGLPDKERERIPQVASTWLPDNGMVVWTDGGILRLDAISRQAVALFLTREFRVYGRHGWVSEGFGLYFSYKLVSTRLSLSVRETEYVDKERNPNFLQRLRAEKANWFRLAHEALTGETKPSIVFLLGKDVNSLTVEDLFYAYSLAAYILELHQDKAEPILRRIGKGDAPATVLEEELGAKLPQIEEHLIAWLTDMR